MIILLEAVDGCGKTTLAKKLCRTYKAKYVHVSKPKTDNPFLEYVKTLKRLNVNRNYVFDRCFHGERAYGPVFRGKDGLTDEKQFYLETLIRKHNPRMIYCWQGHNEIASVFCFRGEKHTKLENVPALEKLYEKTLEKCTIPVLRYRWSTDSYRAVKKFIGCPTGQPRIKEQCCSLIGDMKPDVLFIGDSKNPRTPHLPVFCSTSGLFLMKALKHVDKSFAVVNSLHNNKLLTWKELYHFNARKLVFLGQVGFKRLKPSLEFCHKRFGYRVVSHPQFAKRFYGKEAVERYTKEIMEAIQ